MNFSQKNKYLKGIEQAAMTDIVFILLIFFLLTSSFVVQTGITIDLPKTKHMKPLIDQDIIVTIVNNGNLIYLNDKKIPRSKLFETLKKKIAINFKKLVIFRADKNIPLGKIISIMDTAKRAGALKVAIATREK